MSVRVQRHADRTQGRCILLASRSGQSLIESCLVIALISLILFGLLQVSQLFAAKEVLRYAAGRGLRAKAVGFNRFMVFKTVRVGAIPSAGKMVTPAPVGGPAAQHTLEAPHIPLYLGANDYGDLPAILDYQDWDTIHYDDPTAQIDGTLRLVVAQDVPLRFAMHRAFYAADDVALAGESYLESHYDLYMNDEGR